MKEITLPAALENLASVQAFVEEELVSCGCSTKSVMQVSVAVEEIYVNIARYAYRPAVGDVTVRCAVEGSPLGAEVQFLDRGQPFDPLGKPDANTVLSAEEREIGGLGILIAKRSVDEMAYRYEGGFNILTLRKYL